MTRQPISKWTPVPMRILHGVRDGYSFETWEARIWEQVLVGPMDVWWRVQLMDGYWTSVRSGIAKRTRLPANWEVI